MHRHLAVMLVVGCSGGTATPKSPTSRLEFLLRDAGVSRFVRAAQAHDAVALEGMLNKPLTFGGAWFDDATCLRQFASAGTVSSTTEFARCLARLPLSVGERKSMHPEIAIVTYAPGIELELLFGGRPEAPVLRWIGYASRVGAQDVLPTITQEAFEAHRIDPTPLALDAATQASVDAELAETPFANKLVFSWLKVCVDTQGTITRVQPRLTSSLKAVGPHEAFVRTWKMRPVQLGTQPTPVCSMIRVGAAPSDRDLGAMPLPIPQAHENALHIAPWLVEKRMTAGTKFVVPDDVDKERIHDSGVRAIVGMFHYCLDGHGSATSPSLIRSTGIPGYDKKILAKIAEWRFRPLEHEGAPAAVCTFALFTYSQR